MAKEITVASECETSIDSRKKSDRRKKWDKFIRKDKIVFNDKFAQAVFLLPAILVFSVFTVYPALRRCIIRLRTGRVSGPIIILSDLQIMPKCFGIKICSKRFP